MSWWEILLIVVGVISCFLIGTLIVFIVRLKLQLNAKHRFIDDWKNEIKKRTRRVNALCPIDVSSTLQRTILSNDYRTQFTTEDCLPVDEWEVDWMHVKVDEQRKLGVGAFSNVYLGYCVVDALLCTCYYRYNIL